MRDEPNGAVDQREPMMESVPAQRSHEYADDGDGADRAVGVAPVPDDAEEAHEARAEDDEFRPADTATTDAERADAERADGVDAERADAERAGEWNGRSAVDVELPEDGEDRAAGEEGAWDNRAAGGVPDDAVSSADAPVPAAAYESADSGEHIDREDRDELAERDDQLAAEHDDQTAADRAGDEAHGELMPGDVPEQPVDALFDQATAGDFRDRWQRVQMQFVDDPRAAADEARSLVDDVLNALHDGLNNQRGALDGWQSGQPDDTEQLRVAIRRYRDFMDRMLGL